MKKEVWIINGERIELNDVIETYRPTDADRKEVELYRKKKLDKKLFQTEKRNITW
jgi:hypothetical protein